MTIQIVRDTIIKLARKNAGRLKPTKKSKKFEKFFKNLLTKGFESDIIIGRSLESVKIEP